MKLSIYPFSTGFPGRIQSIFTPFRCPHSSTAREVNSVPLPVVLTWGIPCASWSSLPGLGDPYPLVLALPAVEGLLAKYTGKDNFRNVQESGVGSNQSRLLFPRRKQMATPIIDIPRSINASESGRDVPVAITPTINPTIENNHRIIRSPRYQQVGLPTICPNEQNICKFRTVADPSEYLRNRYAVPRWEPQNCKGSTTLYEYDIPACFVRECKKPRCTVDVSGVCGPCRVGTYDHKPGNADA